MTKIEMKILQKRYLQTSPVNGLVIAQQRLSRLPDILNFGTSIF